jgi:general secretion pathway protein A
MYNDFFGLRQDPFKMTPDPGCLFMTRQHREALAGLTYAILDQKGLVVLTGDAGTGKTTLMSKALQSLPANRVRSSVILNPTLTPVEFLELALLDFGFTDVPASKAQRIATLQEFLLQGQRDGKTSALVIDEAHKLSPEVIEEVRLLGNFEAPDQKLLQIVLLGQNELNGLLNRPDLRQFKQRIALRLTIEPLPAAEVEQYIRYRWAKAGGDAAPFTYEAVGAVAQVSDGIPRVINALCDNALMQAVGEGSRTVQKAHVMQAAADLFLLRRSAPAGPPTFPGASPATPAYEASPLKTLERYDPRAAQSSRWNKFTGRVGLTQKMRTV